MIGPALAAGALAGGGTAGALWIRSNGTGRLGELLLDAEMEASLAVLEIDKAGYAGRTIFGVGAAMLVAGLIGAALRGPMGAALGAGVGAALGVLITHRLLSSQAKARRRLIRQATVEVAEMVSLALGAGRGMTAALRDASETCRCGPLASALIKPRPGEALSELGASLAVVELGDLGATITACLGSSSTAKDQLLGWAKATHAVLVADAETALAVQSEALVATGLLVVFGVLVMVGAPILAALGK
jgi:pilus assembly protein TadC